MVKPALVTILLISVPPGASGQVPDTLWSRLYNIMPDLDNARCVQQTTDGGYIVTGSCVPTGEESHIDLLLFKTDPTGTMMWRKWYNKGFVEQGASVQQTSDGGYVVGGRAVSLIGPTLDKNQSDVWVLRADSHGETLWTKTFGGPGNDYCTCIRQTSDLGFILTGTLNGGLYSYPPDCILDFSSTENARAWLIKADSHGDTLWTRTFDPGSYGYSVEQTPDSGFVLVGSRMSQNQLDILIARTNSSGQSLWTKIIGRSDAHEFARTIRQTGDGYIVAGHIGPIGVGAIDALLVKTDANGEVVWSRSYGNKLSDSGNSVEVTTDGEFIVVGIANANWYIHQGDMWVFKTDSRGDMLWERVYDIRLNDYAWGGALTSGGGFVVTGMVAGGGLGDGDIWLAKFGREVTGVENRSSIVSDPVLFHNYPNPFNPQTTIEYRISKTENVTLIVYDILGREVTVLVNERKPPGLYSVTVDSKGLASGVYCYRLSAGDYVQTRKLLLLR
jgi:hypothetical protein